jgi:hypothetical protein
MLAVYFIFFLKLLLMQELWLLDGLGNRYGLKKSVPTKDGVFTWLCTRRGRKNEVSCAAYVKKLGDVFTEGATAHCHEPNPRVVN